MTRLCPYLLVLFWLTAVNAGQVTYASDRSSLFDSFEAPSGGWPIKSSEVQFGVYPILSLTPLSAGSRVEIFARLATFTDHDLYRGDGYWEDNYFNKPSVLVELQDRFHQYGVITQYDKLDQVYLGTGEPRRYLRVFDENGKQIPVREAVTRFADGKRFAWVTYMREARSPQEAWAVLVLEELGEKEARKYREYQAAIGWGEKAARSMLRWAPLKHPGKNRKWCAKYPNGARAISQEAVDQCADYGTAATDFAWYQEAAQKRCGQRIDDYCHH